MLQPGGSVTRLEHLEHVRHSGNASKIKVLPLAVMAQRYANGELDPKIAGVASKAAE